MLNTILKVFCYVLALIYCRALAADKGDEIIKLSAAGDGGIRVIRLADALDEANINFHDTISDVYACSIKSEYYTWIYNHSRLKVLDEKRTLYSDLLAISELHYKSGESALISKALAETEYLKVESQYSDAGNDVLVSENNLRKLLFINDDIQPGSDSLEKYYLPPGITEIEESDSITGDYADFILLREYVNLMLLLNKYEGRLVYYGKIMNITQRLVDAVRLKYESEDIEYYDYVDLMSGAIDLRLKYLKALNSYNQAALKIELYVNKYLNNEKD